MERRRGGGFTGGGPAAFNAHKLKNTSVPPIIKCEVCLREKDRSQFSNKQIENIRFKLFGYGKNGRDNANTKPIEARCRTCTGQPSSELQCIMCGEIKDLSMFAKAQRKKADLAKCLACMDEVLATQPDDGEVPYSDGDDDDSSGSESNFAHTDGASSVSNPWELLQDGDYMTTSDQNSTRAVSETASMTGSHGYSTNKGKGPAVLTTENIRALNRAGPGRYSSSRVTPSSAQNVSQASRNLLSNHEVSSVQDDLSVSASGYEDNGNDLGPAQPDAVNDWNDYSNFNAATSGSKVKHVTAQSFNAWGPQGQSAIHHRAQSTVSASSTTRPLPRTTRRKVDNSDGAKGEGSKWAKVRPENQKTAEEKAARKGKGPYTGGIDDAHDAW